jgi:hypothetical protein
VEKVEEVEQVEKVEARRGLEPPGYGEAPSYFLDFRHFCTLTFSTSSTFSTFSTSA